MTYRKKHIVNKRKEIKKIAKHQVRLIKKAVALIAKPSKRMDVNLRRIGKMLAFAMHIRALEMQKQMIIAQPIPNYVPGGIAPGSLAIVGEGERKELIITPNGFVNVPTFNQHPDPHQ
jgi:hypothetical protein